MTKPRGMTIKNRLGDRFGRLVVVERAENRVEPSGAVRAQWLCNCDCGGSIVVPGHSLQRGLTRSCGCLLREKTPKHGMALTRVYRIWSSIRQRCENPVNTAYHRYGGRGIEVCERWKDFENFYADMGDCPPDMTVERIDNDRGYEPGNCRWASRLEQANNRSVNVHITHKGEKKTLAEWGRVTGLGKQTITQRLAKGWSIERILTEPLVPRSARTAHLHKPKAT
jgi:hypothetical protein